MELLFGPLATVQLDDVGIVILVAESVFAIFLLGMKHRCWLPAEAHGYGLLSTLSSPIFFLHIRRHAHKLHKKRKELNGGRTMYKLK